LETEKPNIKNIGHYEIISQIGAGGMGEVYLARDSRLNRLAALKILHEEVAANAERLLRFEREARAVSALNHPNILTIYDFADDAGVHFLASEYVRGETLRDRLNRAPMSVVEALEVSIQIASALQAAHEAGVIHRDIKPENIMIRDDGYAKVLDFGLAKLTEEEPADDLAVTRRQAQTLPGVIMGTASYMSPEQARGRALDARTDVFSFGAVLFEMLARRQLFTGETINHIIVAVLENEPPPLSLFVNDYPLEIERIVKKCVAKAPENRFQTARDLLADLKRLQKRLEFEAELRRAAPGESQSQIDTQAFEAGTLTIFDEKTPAEPPHNLSLETSPLVGREKEIAAIKNLLRQNSVRLLTLTGIGGTGKTRLSQAVAREMLADFADGVFFIELSAITDAELVASTVAQTLGVKETGAAPILETLKDYLRARRFLLVTDNFEQVTSAAAQVAEMLAAAPHLKILVTSRTLLHLSLEREFAVPPLALPDDAATLSAEELAKYEAVKLFVERAQNAKANFALTAENSRAVAEICARLDGLPLAIELAAARVKILSPAAILAKLENRLQLLTGGAADLPERQQTMRGAVAWSYDLLDASEKRLFETLSVFAGGFTFEAAEAVVSGQWSVVRENSLEINKPTADHRPPTTVLDDLTSLVDKSLVVAKEQPDGEMRFRMLEVVREFAAESLETGGADEAARRAHAEYFLALGEEAEKHLKGKHSVKWLDRLEEEHDNLRAALRWFLQNDVKSAARLAASARLFWLLHSHLTEGRDWLERALENVRHDATVDARFSLLNMLGTLARFQGDYEAGRRTYRELLREGEAAEDFWHIAEANSGLGSIAYQEGDFATARKFIEESLKISREMDEKYGIAAALNSLGDIARTEGDFASARQLFEESLAISRSLGIKQFICAILANLGAVTFGEGDFTAARRHFSEALATAQEMGNRAIISLSLDGFAALAAERGEAEQAAQIEGAAERLRESIGYEIEPADLHFRDSFLAKIRATLSEDDLSVSFEKGRRLKPEEAVALCLNN
jgi:predicted ATPase/serine/threonine protein kinase/Tfp pilus assembly protein PilF